MRSTSKLVLGLFWAALSIPHASSADNKVGNGGNVVRCKMENGTQIQLLDFYEHSPLLSTPGKDEQSIALNAIAKIKDVAPKLYEQYKNLTPQITFK